MGATMSEDEDYVICGSEDGNLCIWNRVNQYVPVINPMYHQFLTKNRIGLPGSTRITTSPWSTSVRLEGHR